MNVTHITALTRSLLMHCAADQRHVHVRGRQADVECSEQHFDSCVCYISAIVSAPTCTVFGHLEDQG